MKTLKTQREVVALHRIVRWFCCNVAFVSWHKHWKGIYLHFFPRYCVRVFLWGVDWHRKNPLIHSPNNLQPPPGDEWHDPDRQSIEIEERVIAKILQRRDTGRAKYGTTMEREDLSFIEWVQHLQEELMDAAIYAEKIIRDHSAKDAKP